MKFYKISDFKVGLKIETPENYKNIIPYDYFYFVPRSKNHNNIKPLNTDEYDYKIADAYISSGSNYNGTIKIYNNGVICQYRDGCFYPYIGKIAID